MLERLHKFRNQGSGVKHFETSVFLKGFFFFEKKLQYDMLFFYWKIVSCMSYLPLYFLFWIILILVEHFMRQCSVWLNGRGFQCDGCGDGGGYLTIAVK